MHSKVHKSSMYMFITSVGTAQSKSENISIPRRFPQACVQGIPPRCNCSSEFPHQILVLAVLERRVRGFMQHMLFCAWPLSLNSM